MTPDLNGVTPEPKGAQRGASAVEMAILTPLLLLLSMGVIDVGRVLFTYIGLQEAAQEGALFGSYYPSDPSLVRERTVDSVDSPALADGDVAVACGTGSAGTRNIEVTVSHDLNLITPVIGAWLGGSVHLERAVRGGIHSSASCSGDS